MYCTIVSQYCVDATSTYDPEKILSQKAVEQKFPLFNYIFGMLDVLFSQLIGNICIFLLNQITYLLTCSLNIPDDGTRTSNFTKLFLSMDFY